MAIPFLSYFKKKPKPEAVAAAPLPPPERKSERKTVMPSSRAAAERMPELAIEPAPMPSASNLVPAPAAAAPAPRSTIAFGGTTAPRPAPAPAPAPVVVEPATERTVSLEIADVVRHIPAGFAHPLTADGATLRISLRAAELERGMANGKPAVSLASLYAQAPELFAQPVGPNDDVQVALPFSAVLEQFSNLQTRSDQHRPSAVPQVQTPFLKVTLEDDQRFGTETPLREIADLPTVRVEPATAATIAAAEPEPVAKETLMSMPAPKPFSFAPPAAANGNATAAPARIPFKLTPPGTDVPAPERVPASSGPSVPTSLPTPTRIPFKVTAPSEDIRPKHEQWVTKASVAADEEAELRAKLPPAPKPVGPTVSLALKPILESLPPMQLTGELDNVSPEARVEVPVALLEPQLVSGRVAVSPEEFAASMPDEYRKLFSVSAMDVPVSLPLQEVLKNLPAASLRMRDDQEEQEQGANFETPFSTKAAEDAKRLDVPAAPVAKPTVAAPVAEPALAAAVATAPEPVLQMAAPAPVVEQSSEPVAQEVTAPAIEKTAEPAVAEVAEVKAPAASAPLKLATGKRKPGERTALQAALDTDDELDAKSVVAHVGKMEGVEACALMFGDGLSLAGNLPSEYEAEGLCAMGPVLLQRVENHMVETKLGALKAMTLSCAKAAVTFFMHENLCLAALHPKAELALDIRERLGCAVHELSRQYSQPA